MKSLLKVLTGIIIIPLFVLLILSSFVKLRLLNPSFWSNAYSRPVFQETIKEKVNLFAEAYVKEQLAKEGLSDNLVGEKFIENEVRNLTSSMDETTVVNFLDTNTTRLLDYINGKEDMLTVYLPLNEMGLDIDSSVLNTIQVSPGEYEVTKLLSHPSGEGFSNIFNYVTQIGSLSTIFLAVTVFVFLIFTYIYFSITKKVASLGKFILFLGIVGLLTAIPVYLFQQSPGIPVDPSEPASVLISIFYPIIVSGLISYILIFSGITFGLGIAILAFGKFAPNKNRHLSTEG